MVSLADELNPVGATNNLRGLAAKIEFLSESNPQCHPGETSQHYGCPFNADGGTQSARKTQIDTSQPRQSRGR